MEKTAGSVLERMRESQGSLHRGKEILFVHKRVCVCGHVYVVYEDTNLYNDMGMT